MDASTQVYRWPARLDRLSSWLFVLGVASMAGGYLVMSDRSEADEMASTTVGLLLMVTGAAALTGIALTHACLAREIHFHRLYLVLRQTGRDDLVLPYSTYDDQWVVDFTRPMSLRLIMAGDHRGCTIVDPPLWMREALAEVARIQEEEGWAEPE